MSGLDPQKPNLVFTLSPVKSFHKDPLQSLCDARLNITGAIVRHDAEASLQDYYKYDYIALGGRPVSRRQKRLVERSNRKYCTIQIEITNNDMEPTHEWELIVSLSGRQGKNKRRFPIIQIFKTYEPILTRFIDEETGKEKEEATKRITRPLTKKTNEPKHTSLMLESSKKKRLTRIRKFYTKVIDPPGEPIKIYILKQHFNHPPVGANRPKDERETLTYTFRLAGKRKDFDQTLFFHLANMFIPVQEQRSLAEIRADAFLSERQSELEAARDEALEEDIREIEDEIRLLEEERRILLEER
jgi:hypothetical protein